YLAVLAFVFWAELQPLLIVSMLGDVSWATGYGMGVRLLHQVAAIGILFGIVVATFQRRLGGAGFVGRLHLAVTGLTILIAAIELPLLLWLLFLDLSYWGLAAAKGATSSVPSPLLYLYFLVGVDRIVQLYCIVATSLLFIAILLKPNALTLHGLYRDRLRRA